VATNAFPDTNWHFITIVTASAITANNVVVGLAASNYFSGSLDDIRMYNRALSASEVSTLYHMGTDKIAAPEASKGDTNGLVGYWSFDGSSTTSTTATDLSTSGNNGTISGATPAMGKIGQALSFDGTTSHVSEATAINGVKTISFWMKASSVVSKKIMNVDGTTQIEINGSSNVVATSFPSATVYIDGSVASAVDTNWHFVTITDTTGVNFSAMDIGRVVASYFAGSLDEVRVYNYALSQGEITSLYNLGQAVIRR